MTAAAPLAQSAQERPTVVLRPGLDIQAIVERSPEGARFLFEPGVYRNQSIHPKSRQEFIGQQGVILSGAMELDSWTRKSPHWEADGLPAPLSFHGECADGRDDCKFREDLFVDGRLYRRVSSIDDLGPGTWRYEKGRAYLAEDATGRSVELGVTPRAFGGDAKHVVLRDLIVEKYASDSQEGAIYADEGRGWLIADVVARWNHGAGLTFGPETQVMGGAFSHNGQLGMAGIGENSKVDDVEIAFNNYAGYDAKWEAGGTKFWATTGLVVQNSCIHHNGGPGLWTDNDNIDVVFHGNKVFMNANSGIKHEISYDAVIRDNIVLRNGTSGFDDWLWGSQILIQNSKNVEVTGNLVEVSTVFGNGVGIIHQDRGEGVHGPWDAVNNTVHNNTIIHLGQYGQSGVVTDTDGDWFWTSANNNDFDQNNYIVADRSYSYWTSEGRDENWEDIRTLEFEENGELIAEKRTAMELSCR